MILERLAKWDLKAKPGKRFVFSPARKENGRESRSESDLEHINSLRAANQRLEPSQMKGKDFLNRLAGARFSLIR